MSRLRRLFMSSCFRKKQESDRWSGADGASAPLAALLWERGVIG